MNRLASETSPYLRQHQDNPVDWFAWGDPAFAEARARNVPVLLSVGYSACHWCHVMAHECFEDAEVAERMNASFVNVKVDREERPDVDAIYMDAVQAMTGRGGWPMTVFMTPTGEPFYGGTYYPREQFLKLLDAVDDVWHNRPADVTKNVTTLVAAIDATANLKPSDDLPSVEQMNTCVQLLGRAHDAEHGGFGSTPKFPTTANLELMLRAYMSSGSEGAKRVLQTTLDAMASGGIYDHLGGGFARYSTDREWLVPHFEKMLYDQALMAKTYLHGLVVLRVPAWRQVVQETVEYVVNTMMHPEGGFFSAEDADSLDDDGNSVEGRFYTWTPDEIRAALPDVKPEVIEEALAWWNITDEGNWEGRSIPNRLHARGELERNDAMNYIRHRLVQARATRPRPAVDDKVILEWNALFLSTLSEAAGVFAHRPWLDAAITNAEFLLRELRGPDGRWYRTWHADGEPRARHAALAADHAALVDAFTRLAEASGQARWIEEAQQVADTMLDYFFDPSNGGLFTTAEDAEALVVRQKDIIDSATPSANSHGALALYRLASLTGELRYAHQADRMLQLIAAQIADKPTSFSNALLATDVRRRGATEVAITGDRPDLVRIAQSIWRPDIVLAWGEPYDGPMWEGRSDGLAYVCKDHVCKQPATTPEEFAEMLLGRPVTIRDSAVRADANGTDDSDPNTE
ncbi:MAG: thioredoxin domain-containing protein [Ilumatobacter sp.]|uniref:thioredoxin domain-containing protein n=1 Tax=Ilumatobacter sp. TaxID=1967498 RepID=UPI00391DA0A8